MRGWIATLARSRLSELALAVALGYAAASLADEFARVAIHVLAQHFGNDLTGSDDTILGLLNLFSTAPYALNFTIGETLVVYGEIVSATLALALVALIGAAVIRRQARRFSGCPFCGARAPHDATRCAICGSAFELAGR